MNMEGFSLERTFSTGLPDGTYCDIISGDFNPSTRTCTGTPVIVDAKGYADIHLQPFSAVALHKGALINSDCIGDGCIDDRHRIDTLFTCHSGDTYLGQSVYAVGNIPEFGSWDPNFALRLVPDNYPLERCYSITG